MDSDYDKMIDEINQEFNKRINESEHNLSLSNKTKLFYEALEKKYSEICKNQIQNVEKYENMGLGKLSKEEQEQSRMANSKLEECKRPFINYINNFSYISQYSRRMFTTLNDYCYKDCKRKFGESKPEYLKNCLRQCTEYSVSFAHPAYADLLSSTCDSFQSEIEKMKL